MLSFPSMDPFVRRLAQRLNDPAQPLSRNRHFHTLDTPEGKAALKLARRLRSLQRDLLACHREGRAAQLRPLEGQPGEHRLELRLERIAGRRTSLLSQDELALLLELAGVREALGLPQPAAAVTRSA
jgi:hypothetical protein